MNKSSIELLCKDFGYNESQVREIITKHHGYIEFNYGKLENDFLTADQWLFIATVYNKNIASTNTDSNKHRDRILEEVDNLRTSSMALSTYLSHLAIYQNK